MEASHINLLERLSAADPVALGELSDMFTPALLGFASTMLHEPFLAKDIIQDVFIRFWQYGGQFESISRVRSFLFVAVRNACNNQNEKFHIRKQKRRAVEQVEPDEVMRNIILSEYLAVIYKAVDELPEKLQQVFYLSFEENLTPEEISVHLNIPYQTVKNRKGEVYKLLREKLKHHAYLVPFLTKVFLS